MKCAKKIILCDENVSSSLSSCIGFFNAIFSPQTFGNRKHHLLVNDDNYNKVLEIIKNGNVKLVYFNGQEVLDKYKQQITRDLNNVCQIEGLWVKRQGGGDNNKTKKNNHTYQFYLNYFRETQLQHLRKCNPKPIQIVKNKRQYIPKFENTFEERSSQTLYVNRNGTIACRTQLFSNYKRKIYGVVYSPSQIINNNISPIENHQNLIFLNEKISEATNTDISVKEKCSSITNPLQNTTTQ